MVKYDVHKTFLLLLLPVYTLILPRNVDLP